MQRSKLDIGSGVGVDAGNKRLHGMGLNTSHLYGDLPGPGGGSVLAHPFFSAGRLGIPVPNLAPDVEHEPAPPPVVPAPLPFVPEDTPKEPRKKKYAKEAWPGKKPTHSLLV